MNRNLAIFIALSASITYGGCNQQNERPGGTTPATLHAEQKPSTSVVSPTDEEARSPAFLAGGIDSPSATPEEIITAFLEALRSGNDELADRLLSTQARRSARREGYDLRPPGTPSDVYRVGSARFVSATKNAAHVPTQWSASFPGGEIEQWDITWVLRKEESAGWRVTGMRAQLFPDDPKRFLNFEDFADVKQQLAQAEKDLAAAASRSGVRQASADSDPLNDQNRNAFPE